MRPALEVADIVRGHLDSFLERYGPSLSYQQRRVLNDVAACRTATLGGHREQCSACGQLQISYNSCRNRHCPKCQGTQRAAWLEQQTSHLLPVDYHHVVFTLPAALAPLALQNPKAVYGLLFQAAAATVQTVAADPKRLGAQVGLVMVLHSWGQNLSVHPHVHVMATGGGFSCDAKGKVDPQPRWVACRPGFFLPVRVLSRVFRGKFLDGLRRGVAAGELRFHGMLAALAEPAAFARWLAPLYETDWVVYCKPPFGGPEVVLKYLARYTHRVALSNDRLLTLTNGQVSFHYKDYAHGCRWRTLTLAAEEFLRRFVQHVLPKGFMRIRSYGLLANTVCRQRLAVCWRLLLVIQAATTGAAAPAANPAAPSAGGRRCPFCGGGPLLIIVSLAADIAVRDSS